MSQIKTITKEKTYIDETGKERKTIDEKTFKVERSREPDYIKLYTKMWCEFNQIPHGWQRDLFYELICRMSYADASDPDGSQVVAVAGPIADSIIKAMGWKSRDMLTKGLTALCKFGAIRRVSRGIYQINPKYASRGEWKYNPALKRGGVEELITTFVMSTQGKSVQTTILWSDDPEDQSPEAKEYRKDLGDGHTLTEQITQLKLNDAV